MQQLMFELEPTYWQVTKHYSRKTKGAKQFTRPGENLVLRSSTGDAVWVTWRSKFKRKDKFGYAWECSLFRNESDLLSSEMIKNAILKTIDYWGPFPNDGLITYVAPNKVSSKNPGYSFLRAGFQKVEHVSKKGLLVYRITNEMVKQVKEIDYIAESIHFSLEDLENGLELGDSCVHDLLDSVQEDIKTFYQGVKAMKKQNNYGYQDALFKLEQFFQFLGGLDEDMEKIYWGLMWS